MLLFYLFDVRHRHSNIRGMATKRNADPKAFENWSREIMSKYKLKNTEVLFVGDAMADYEAAIECKMHFVLRTHEENEILFKFISCRKIPDLKKLTLVVKEINTFKK